MDAKKMEQLRYRMLNHQVVGSDDTAVVVLTANELQQLLDSVSNNPNNKRYLLLLGWVEGSDSAGGEKTGINYQADLLPQFQDNNHHVFAVEVYAPTVEIAAALGYEQAFHENYTGHDTVSTCVEIDGSFTLPVQTWTVLHA